MRIRIYTESANHIRYGEMLRDFAIGVAGDSVSLWGGNHIDTNDVEDVAVIFGSWKDRDAPHHNIKRLVVERDIPFIVFETPIVGRQEVTDYFHDDWYRVGINGFLADDGLFQNHFSKDDSRWKKVQKELGVVKEPWRIRHLEQPIIVALQLPGDASLRGTDISKWAVKTCLQIREHTERKIILRFPQLNRQFDLRGILDISNIEGQAGTKENLIPTLKNAHCSVSYSSGLAVDSILAGCPVFVDSKASFAYDMAARDLSYIEDPLMLGRDQWLYNLCNCQWSIEEIKDGTVWKHLKKLL